MQESIILTPSLILQCRPISTAPWSWILPFFIFCMISSLLVMDSLLSPCTQMFWFSAVFPPKSVIQLSLPCSMSFIASKYRFGVPMSNQLPFNSYPYTGLPVLIR